jgi:putative colanic acid biosynthesis UDP-glucose lipid carrier transferase
VARSLLKPHAAMFAALFRVCDPLSTLIVGLLAHRAYLDSFALPDHYQFFLAAGALVVAAVFPAFSLYEPHRGAAIAEELRRLTMAWLLIAAIVGSAMFATKMGDTYSRVWVGAWLVGGYIVTAAMRIVVRSLLRSLRARGLNQRHVAIVGAGTLGRTVANRLRQSPWAGFSIFRFYDDDPALIGTSVADRPVLAIDPGLPADVAAGHVDQVWLALPLRAEARIREVLTLLRDHAVEVRFVPDIYSFHLLNHSVTEVAGLPVISLTETPMSGINRVVKAIEDYTLAMILVALTSPLMLAIAAGVKLSSRGPVLYRQQRVT